MTYVVAFFPDATLNVAAVGPFRTQDKAERVAEDLTKALDPPEADEMPDWSWRRPHVVQCMTAKEAVEQYGIEEER